MNPIRRAIARSRSCDRVALACACALRRQRQVRCLVWKSPPGQHCLAGQSRSLKKRLLNLSLIQRRMPICRGKQTSNNGNQTGKNMVENRGREPDFRSRRTSSVRTQQCVQVTVLSMQLAHPTRSRPAPQREPQTRGHLWSKRTPEPTLSEQKDKETESQSEQNVFADHTVNDGNPPRNGAAKQNG